MPPPPPPPPAGQMQAPNAPRPIPAKPSCPRPAPKLTGAAALFDEIRNFKSALKKPGTN